MKKQLARKNANVESIRLKINSYKNDTPVIGILDRPHTAADARRVILNTGSSATALNGRVSRNTFEVARVGVKSALAYKKSYETALLKAATQLSPGKYRTYIKMILTLILESHIDPLFEIFYNANHPRKSRSWVAYRGYT